MKNIEFSDEISTLHYRKYIEDVKETVSVLSKEDQEDILMEINSHIYESIQQESSVSEVEKIAKAIKELGDIRETIAPLVADRKLSQATKTFNPAHIAKALSLNISNGFIYVLFSILYLSLLSFVFIIFAELFYPDNTGLFVGEDKIQFGFSSQTNQSLTEVTGNWFIPLVLMTMIVIYLAITMLLRLKYKLRHKK